MLGLSSSLSLPYCCTFSYVLVTLTNAIPLLFDTQCFLATLVAACGTLLLAVMKPPSWEGAVSLDLGDVIRSVLLCLPWL